MEKVGEMGVEDWKQISCDSCDGMGDSSFFLSFVG